MDKPSKSQNTVDGHLPVVGREVVQSIIISTFAIIIWIVIWGLLELYVSRTLHIQLHVDGAATLLVAALVANYTIRFERERKQREERRMIGKLHVNISPNKLLELTNKGTERIAIIKIVCELFYHKQITPELSSSSFLIKTGQTPSKCGATEPDVDLEFEESVSPIIINIDKPFETYALIQMRLTISYSSQGRYQEKIVECIFAASPKARFVYKCNTDFPDQIQTIMYYFRTYCDDQNLSTHEAVKMYLQMFDEKIAPNSRTDPDQDLAMHNLIKYQSELFNKACRNYMFESQDKNREGLPLNEWKKISTRQHKTPIIN